MKIGKRFIVIIAVIAALILIGGFASNYSTFFFGGTTKGILIDKNGQMTGDSFKQLSYAQGELTARSYGATYWTLKPVDEEGYTENDKSMAVFFSTGPNTCRYTLMEKTNPIDIENVILSVYNLASGNDYKAYKISTWNREQSVQVVALGPTDTEQKLATALRSASTAVMINDLPFRSMMKEVINKGYGYEFDAYEDDVVNVGPGNIYKIKFAGTTQGKYDCGGLVDSTDTVILYSAKTGKVAHVSKEKLSTLQGYTAIFGSTYLLNTILHDYNLESDDLDGQTFGIDKNTNTLWLYNEKPGVIPITIIMPTELFFNPITGTVSEEETIGSTPVSSEFLGYGESAPCDFAIRDIAFSSDNSNKYTERDSITTYIKIENLGDAECLLSISGKSDHATIDSKSMNFKGYETKQVPIGVIFGNVADGEIQDNVVYKVCSTSTLTGETCKSKSVSYTLSDKDYSPTPIPTPPPEPDPELTCQERAQSRECFWNDYSCMWSRQLNEWSCYEYFLPSILGIGGITLVIVAGVGSYIGYRLLKKKRWI